MRNGVQKNFDFTRQCTSTQITFFFSDEELCERGKRQTHKGKIEEESSCNTN